MELFLHAGSLMNVPGSWRKREEGPESSGSS